MTDIQTEAGLFSRIGDSREIEGLLLPFGELSRPNLSGTEPVMFSASAVALPRDPSIVTLNDEHDRFNPLGRGVQFTMTDAGVVGRFRVAETDEGDSFLASYSEGTGKRKLSAELGSLVRNGATAVRSRLTGAAVCADGAFESAALFSLAEGVEAEETTEEPTPKTTDAAPVAEETPKDLQEEVMTAAAAGQIPAPLATPGVTAPVVQEVDLHAVFSAMASLKGGGSEDAEKALFALADVKTAGTGALPGAGVIQPNWVGHLWQGRRYQRKFMDLATHTYGPIDLGGRAGFRINQDTALVQERTTGEKTELPTGSASTSRRESSRKSYGFAVDVAAEWSYLSGGAEILQSFWEGVVDSYAKVTDEAALRTLFAVASAGDGAALSRRVAPGALPTGTPANSQYSSGVVQLIEAIEAISDADDDPSWVVVNPVLWRQLLLTPKDLLPEFVSLGVTAGTGTGAIEGKVTIKKAPQAFFPGTKATDPQVVAGSKRAVEFKELGETPIQIDAVNVAKFGVDRSVVGFVETFIVRPESTIFIGTAA